MFDLVEAQKAVARVRERSIGPDTVHDLAALVAQATTRIATLEADEHAAKMQLATETEQLHNQLADADRNVLAAIQARDAAIATERDHAQIVQLAIELDRLVDDITATQTELTQTATARAAERAQTAATLQAAAATIATITAERDAAVAKVATHAAVLAQIADAAWWDRIKAAGIARAALHGDR